MHEQVLIRNSGYTDTAYATCGHSNCTRAVLAAVGVNMRNLAPEDVNEVPVGDDTYVTCGFLGESDSDEWCAACGDFLRHGMNCECPDPDRDREPLDHPYPGLANAPEIRALWPTDPHLAAKGAELEADRARRESDDDPDNEELYHYADVAHGEAFWADQERPVAERYPEDRFGPENSE